MPMKFKQIQAFITVAREGNMTLAEEMHLRAGASGHG